MDLIHDLVPYERGLFWILEPRTTIPLRSPVAVGITTHALEAYFRLSKVGYDQGYLAAKAAGKAISRSTEVMDYGKWMQDDMYRLIFGPVGCHYQVVCRFVEGDLTYGVMELWHHQESGDFTNSDLATLEELYPHLLHRLRWHHLIREANRQKTGHLNVQAGHPFDGLTNRELDIVQMVLNGADNQEVAETLGITTNTVKMHLRNVFGKLNLKRRSQLTSLFLSTFIHAPGDEDAS